MNNFISLLVGDESWTANLQRYLWEGHGLIAGIRAREKFHAVFEGLSLADDTQTEKWIAEIAAWGGMRPLDAVDRKFAKETLVYLRRLAPAVVQQSDGVWTPERDAPGEIWSNRIAMMSKL